MIKKRDYKASESYRKDQIKTVRNHSFKGKGEEGENQSFHVKHPKNEKVIRMPLLSCGTECPGRETVGKRETEGV